MRKTKHILTKKILYSIVIILHVFTCVYANINNDSIHKILKTKALSDTSYAPKLIEIIELYKNEGDIDKGLDLLNIELNRFTKVNANADIKSLRNKAEITFLLAGLKQFKGNYPEAQSNYIKAFKLFESIGNKNRMANTMLSIGNLYRLEKQPQKALLIFKSIDISGEQVSNGVKASILNQTALIYDFDLNKYDSALYYYKQALSTFKSFNNKRGISTVSGNIAGALTMLGKHDEALKYRKEALAIDIESNDKEGQIYSYWGLGEILEKMDHSNEAENNYLKALEIAKQLNFKREICDAHGVLADFYAQTKNFEKAFSHRSEAQKMNESIYNTEMANSLNKMQTQFETQRIEQENKILQQDKTIQAANIEKRNNIILGVLIVFALVIILLAFIVKNNIERRRTNQILVSQKLELEKLSIVASETNNAVLITDADGKMLWVNKGFERMYNKTIADFQQSGIMNVKVLSSNKNIEEIFNTAIQKNTSTLYTEEIILANQKNQWIQTTLTPISKNGSIDKVIFIDSDITLLKEAEEQILVQKNQLEIKNKHITQSIDYAQKIQQAILPPKELLTSIFKDYFIYFKPKDIVSGDFYWVKETDTHILFAVIDCTGHGVPGAFMTIFAHNILEHITSHNTIFSPAEILNLLSHHLNESLNRGSEKVSDAMDLMLCSFHKQSSILQFSGAFNGLYHVKSSQLNEYKGDLITIGIIEEGVNFSNQEIKIEANDCIYLFTDGYADQKGGEKGKKFFYKPLKEMLTTNSALAMLEQGLILEKTMQEWKYNHSQIDDMLIMGIKF